MLGEMLDRGKTSFLCHHFYVESKKAILTETESRVVVTRGWGSGN